GQPARTAATARGHFVDTQKYGEVPARHGFDRGAFGIFVDPGHCKGCGECVEVCAALGHDALFMLDKVAEELPPATPATTPANVADDTVHAHKKAVTDEDIAVHGAPESTLER